MLDHTRLLTLMRDFILYDSNIKKIARHQQFFAVQNAMNRINGTDNSDSTGGVIWHTQGSGKSLTMVMLVRKIQFEKAKENPRFVIVQTVSILTNRLEITLPIHRWLPSELQQAKA